MEYAAAKSSICRQCGRSFSPFAPKPGLKLRTKEEAPAPQSPSFLGRFEDFWKRQRSAIIECFECKRKQQVSGAATSTICPACSTHTDLRDYKITSGFSRSIRTRGDVHLTSKGDLASSSIVCRSALIEGRLRGNLHCDDTATINFSGKFPAVSALDTLLLNARLISTVSGESVQGASKSKAQCRERFLLRQS